MTDKSRVGVIICECGSRIKSRIDLTLIQRKFRSDKDISFFKTLPFTCLKPGMDDLIQNIKKHGINRLIIGGCESRLILDKFESKLKYLGLLKGQIEVLNLRGHIASSNDISPEERAKKSVKNINAAVAEMKTLIPTPEIKMLITDPVMIFGKGVSTWPIAEEFLHKNISFLMQEDAFEEGLIYETLKKNYPGYEHVSLYFEKIKKKILKYKNFRAVPKGEFVSMSGQTGSYELVFIDSNNKHNVIKVGMVVSSLDCDLIDWSSEFNYDGKRVVIQNELLDNIENRGFLDGKVIFWINDYESDYRKFSKVSIDSALQLSRTITSKYNKIKVKILYNESMKVNLSSNNDRIKLIKYNENTRPVIQDGVVVITDTEDRSVKNFSWDIFVLSPRRVVNDYQLNIANITLLTKRTDGFLDTFNPQVLPNQIGGGGVYISGSSQYPRKFDEIVVGAKNLAKEISVMIDRSKNEELIVPRIVCKVDEEKCVGCGLAQDICENSCFKISSGKVAKIDPMLCTGGGTCTASCPYGALDLQNSTTNQREIRIKTLANQIEPEEIIVAGCFWGGLASADSAGRNGMFYDSRAHIVGIPCVGQLDPKVLARAFLEGTSGLLLVGCYPNRCHHSYGVDHAWSRVNLIKKLFEMCGIDSRRISLTHADFNKPKEFTSIVNSFTRLINKIGPINKGKAIKSKIQSIYDLTSKNTRVRHLLCTNLRSYNEKDYLGNQSSSLKMDTEFNKELKEEFIQTQILNLLRSKNKKLKSEEIGKFLEIESSFLEEYLPDLNRRKIIKSDYKDRIPRYSIN